MSDVGVTILMLIVLALVALVATTLIVAGFIGVGAIFARFTELTLFQATIVSIPIGMAALYLFGRILSLPALNSTSYDDDWDDDDWDDDLDFEDLPREARLRLLRSLVEELEDEEESGVVAPPKQPRKRRRR